MKQLQEVSENQIENTNLSILFFSVSTNPANKYIGEIFGNDNGKLKKVFDIEHDIKNKEDKTIINGIDGIEFEFTNRLLSENSNLYIINLEVKNLNNNLTRKQRHYLQSVFYNLKQKGFNIKYIDDNFSNLTEKDYIIGHKCSAGDVCTLVSSFKDNYREDNKRIKEILEEIKNGEGNFEEIKNEIISTEIKNILNFQLALENIIITRNELLKKDQKNINDELLREGLENSVLIGNNFYSDKIYKLETKLTDGVLKGSFSILSNLQIKLTDLISVLDQIEKIEANVNKVELLEKIIKTTDDIFLEAEKTARKNGILSILNPKNWFKRNRKLEKLKQLTKQQEINEAMDVMVKLLNYKEITGRDKLGDRYITEIFQEKYPNNKIIQRLYDGIGYFSIEDTSLQKIKSLIKNEDKDFFDQIAVEYMDLSELSTFDIITMGGGPSPNRLYYGDYNDLEKIFSKYEEFLKLLYFQEYAFNYSKYTKIYQKVLYKRGEFYFDEKVDFEKFTKEFFENIKKDFEEKQKDKKNVWERLDYEILEKNEKFRKDLSELNNIFDIKIGDSIFPIYVVNPIGDNENKIITIGTTLENNIEILKELIEVAHIKNRENLQSGIKKEVDDILVMNFDKTDWNINNKKKFIVDEGFEKLKNIFITKKYFLDEEKGIITSVINNNESRHDQKHNPSFVYEDTIYQTDYFLSDMGISSQGYFYEYFLDKYIVDYLVYGLDVRENKTEKNRVTSIEKMGGKVIRQANHQFNKFEKFITNNENLLKIPEIEESIKIEEKSEISKGNIKKKVFGKLENMGYNFGEYLSQLNDEQLNKIYNIINSFNFDTINNFLKTKRNYFNEISILEGKVKNIISIQLKDLFIELFENLNFTEIQEKMQNKIDLDIFIEIKKIFDN